MKTRKREKKKTTQSPENPRVFRRLPNFKEPTQNDGHSTPSPQPTTPSIFRTPAKGEKIENFERERDFGQTSASVQFLRRALKPPSNRHQTTCYHHKRDP